MRILTTFSAGLLFGTGLIVSGMTDPSKVQGFLDIAGKWDPSLAFVMCGAILVGLPAFRFAATRKLTLLDDPIRWPAAGQRIDLRLVLGSLIFGIGWGIAGYCPGPALASIATGGVKPVFFTIAMVAGMAVFELLERLSSFRRKRQCC